MLRSARQSGNSTLDLAGREPEPAPERENGPQTAGLETPLPPPIADRPARWQLAMKEAVRDVAQLCRLLRLPETFVRPAIEAARDFPLFVPRGFLARIKPSDPADPLLRQVLPVAAELRPVDGFAADPVGDLPAQRAPGLLHKYHGRALLVTTGACAVHCRYCFRRHFPYSEMPRSADQWEPALDEIRGDRSIREVILSGGDPLTLVDPLLAELARRLAAIPHVKLLRVHTRLPIMIPERVTPELIDWLCGSRLTPIVVIHANHPQELDDSVTAALEQLARAGAVLLNQAVLLAGVNDDVDTLAALSERLTELRVTPYYLHQLDRVAGAAHFEVRVERGRELIAALRRRLPGYAVPRYVIERPGQQHKLPVELDG